MARFTFHIENMDAVKKRLNAPALIGPPLRRFFERATRALQSAAMLRAPSRSGRLRSGITAKVDPREIPQWGQVSVAKGVASLGGDRYPFILQFSKQTRYRAGVFQGQHTFNWFKGSINDVSGEIGQAKAELGYEVQALWPR